MSREITDSWGMSRGSKIALPFMGTSSGPKEIFVGAVGILRYLRGTESCQIIAL